MPIEFNTNKKSNLQLLSSLLVFHGGCLPEAELINTYSVIFSSRVSAFVDETV